jgi:SAM-dependent methyltransferase
VVAGRDEPALGSWRRSVDLFRLFLREQSDPAVFYTALAADSVRQVQHFTALDGRLLLDVGGGPGYFRRAFEQAGARYVAVDADAGELSAVEPPGPHTVLGSGMALPVRTASVDIAYSSNVLEHVVDPWAMADEMVRVTKPGGWVVISYTSWWGPWGGHETAPWHYLGGARAARRYQRRHGKPPKNQYGRTLFPITVAAGLGWARACSGADLVQAQPRYHPRWAWPVLRVPGAREVVTWNLFLVLRAR